MELLEHRAKMGATERQLLVASSGSQVNSLGKPIEKRCYTRPDIFMIVLSLICLLLGILAVVNVPLAGHLGQKNQLILVGFLLSLMAACTQKQAQLLLITLETRFGTSTLQNFNSILRYSMLDANVDLFLKAAMVFMFVLPLGLSVSYKQFISGSTALPMDPASLAFGPVGPPGLVEGPLTMMLNASLPFLIPNTPTYQSNPLLVSQAARVGSFGFNVQIISENTTALLDAPLANELTYLQSTIDADETLDISTYVNATICTLNSISESPERANPGYWRTLNQSLDNRPNVVTYGTGLNFAVAAGKHDYSFVLASLWDTRKDETYETEAVGFNVFRGQCHATWQITQSGTTKLTNARDCKLAPQFSRPCIGNSTPVNVADLTGADALQAPLTCNSGGVTMLMAWPLYDFLWLQPVSPVWVAAIASTAWAELAYTNGPASWAAETPNNESAWDTTSFPILKYQAPVSMMKTIRTLHRDRWALYLVIAIQPILLPAFFLGRVSLYSTPVSNKFGLIALLAGVSRESLDVLRGAAFSGELRRPVRVRISTFDRDDEGPHENGAASIDYEFDSQGKHDYVKGGKVYG